MEVAVKHQDVPPLVTVHPNLLTSGASNVFEKHEQLLGQKVYEVPTIHVTASKTTAPMIKSKQGYTIPAQTSDQAATYFIRAKCAAGSTVYLHMPYIYGTVKMTGSAQSFQLQGSHQSILAPIIEAGKTPANGEVHVTLKTYRSSDFSQQPIGCLDSTKLQKAAIDLKQTGATKVSVSGHTIDAALPKGSTGNAIISIPSAPGWVCSTNGKNAKAPASYLGLLRIPLEKNTQKVSCSYTPPGLIIGGIIGFLALFACVFIGRWINKFGTAAEIANEPKNTQTNL
jgi:uncharacterized membrane protein YfhO